jgi:hypothetical protein
MSHLARSVMPTDSSLCSCIWDPLCLNPLFAYTYLRATYFDSDDDEEKAVSVVY